MNFDRQTLQKAFDKVSYYSKRIEEVSKTKQQTTALAKQKLLIKEIERYKERRQATIEAYVSIGIEEKTLLQGLIRYRVKVPYFESFLYYEVINVVEKTDFYWTVEILDPSGSITVTDVMVSNLEEVNPNEVDILTLRNH